MTNAKTIKTIWQNNNNCSIEHVDGTKTVIFRQYKPSRVCVIEKRKNEFKHIEHVGASLHDIASQYGAQPFPVAMFNINDLVKVLEDISSDYVDYTVTGVAGRGKRVTIERNADGKTEIMRLNRDLEWVSKAGSIWQAAE